MRLTRNELRRLGLKDAAVENVMRLYEADIAQRDAEAQDERSAWQEAAAQSEERKAEASQLREQLAQEQAKRETAEKQLASWQTQQAEKNRAERQKAAQAAVSAALTAMGVNDAALPLLLTAVRLKDAQLAEDGRLTNEEALLAPVRQAYPAFFAKPKRLGTDRVDPPLAREGALRAADLWHLSEETINRQWSAVQSALREQT